MPCFLAVTTPESETTAILLALEDQVGTVLFETDARSDMFCPRNSDAAVWDRVIVGLTNGNLTVLFCLICFDRNRCTAGFECGDQTGRRDQCDTFFIATVSWDTAI